MKLLNVFWKPRVGDVVYFINAFGGKTYNKIFKVWDDGKIGISGEYFSASAYLSQTVSKYDVVFVKRNKNETK